MDLRLLFPGSYGAVQTNAAARQPAAGPAFIPFLNGGITAKIAGGVITTTSTTPVSTGFGISSLTPYGLKNGSVPSIWLFAHTGLSIDTSADGVQAYIYATTANNIPAAGSAINGGDFQAASSPAFTAIANAQQWDCYMSIYDDVASNTFKVAGTAFAYYIAFNAITGGTASACLAPNKSTWLGWWEV